MAIAAAHIDYLPWWRFIARHRCQHPALRCIHGDEIIFGSNGKRAQCWRCGKFLAHLPVFCSVTGRMH